MTQTAGEQVTIAAPVQDERLLLFEIGDDHFALPVDGVIEVTDLGDVGCIPTIPPDIAGVVNHHGDALVVVHRSKLLRIGEVARTGTERVLVITDRITAAARFGLPVDRVLGLVPARVQRIAGNDSFAQKHAIEGRATTVLDPRRLVERARELIESSAGGIE